MKNILAENMLRFGPRNLSESAKRKLSKLVEQAAVSPNQYSNISLTDAHKKAAAAPQNIISNEVKGANIISFPPNKTPENGNWALNDRQGVITWIGGTMYMVIGKIGKLENNSVVNPELMALIFEGVPGASTGEGGDSTGNPIKVIKTFTVNNLPNLTAAVAKMQGGGKAPADWLANHGSRVIKLYEMAESLGVNTSILKQKDLSAYNNAVKTALRVG